MSDHERWRKRLLGFEELDGEERRQVAAHLFQCASCRSLLEKLQSVEQEVVEMPEISLEAGAMEGLSPEDHRRERESLEKLLRRLDLRSPASVSSSRWERLREFWHPTALLPVAAAIVLLVALLGPWRTEAPGGIESFELRPATQLRGADRPLWREGETVVAQFRLRQSGFPILIHVDELGAISLLHPAETGRPLVAMPAGERLRLPPEGAGEAWVLEAAGERHSFLLANALSAEFDLATLLGRLGELGGEREGVVEAARRLLAETLDAEVERRDLVVGGS